MRICFPVDLIAPLADGWPKPSVQTIFDSVGVFENGGGLITMPASVPFLRRVGAMMPSGWWRSTGKQSAVRTVNQRL